MWKKGKKPYYVYRGICTISYDFKSYYTGDCTKGNRTKRGPPIIGKHFCVRSYLLTPFLWILSIFMLQIILYESKNSPYFPYFLCAINRKFRPFRLELLLTQFGFHDLYQQTCFSDTISRNKLRIILSLLVTSIYKVTGTTRGHSLPTLTFWTTYPCQLQVILF